MRIASRRYPKEQRIMELIKKLKGLELEAKRRQEIFFDVNLNGFKKC